MAKSKVLRAGGKVAEKPAAASDFRTVNAAPALAYSEREEVARCDTLRPVNRSLPRKLPTRGLYALPAPFQVEIMAKLAASTLSETVAWLAERDVKISKSQLSVFRRALEARQTPEVLSLPARFRVRFISEGESASREAIVELLPL